MPPLLTTFGDTESCWLFSSEALSELHAKAHAASAEAVQRSFGSSHADSGQSTVEPSPGKKPRIDLEIVTLAEDKTLQVATADCQPASASKGPSSRRLCCHA